MADVDLVNLKFTTVSDTDDSEVISVIDDAEFVLRGKIDQCSVFVSLAGGSVIAFDQFDIQGQVADGANWTTLRSAFVANSSDELIPIVTAILEALAHGASAAFLVNTKGLFAIRFRAAQAAVTAVAVTRTIEISGR